jgi:hypothetical protein
MIKVTEWEHVTKIGKGRDHLLIKDGEMNKQMKRRQVLSINS